jgi:hypothetical protein
MFITFHLLKTFIRNAVIYFFFTLHDAKHAYIYAMEDEAFTYMPLEKFFDWNVRAHQSPISRNFFVLHVIFIRFRSICEEKSLKYPQV